MFYHPFLKKGWETKAQRMNLAKVKAHKQHK